MAGYAGYSMSNNAVEAYNDYKMPATRALKALGLRKEALDKIAPCEWHHTSKEYNVTDFYDLRELITHRIIKEYSRPRPNPEQLAMRAKVRVVLAEEKKSELESNRAAKIIDKILEQKRNLLLNSKYSYLVKLGRRHGKDMPPHITDKGHALFEFYCGMDNFFNRQESYMFEHIYRHCPRTLERIAEAICWLKKEVA